MPNEELISEFFDLNAIRKNVGEATTELQKFDEAFNRLASIKIDLSGAVGGAKVTAKMKEASVAAADLSRETELLIIAEKERDKINKQLVNNSVKLAALDTQEAKALAIVNKELRDNTAELKNQVRETQAAEGSIEQMRATLIRLQKEYDNLSQAERNSDVGQSQRNSIKALSDDLKALEGATGRYQRNVGNYSGAVKVLEQALDKVNKKLEENGRDNKLSADAVANLVKEQQLLNTFLERQTAAFSTSAQEIKENTNQLQQLAAAGLEGSEAYQKLFAATSALKDETADLKTALTNAAPDDVAINAATDSLRGLVGVYGLAQSAAAVFGDDNEFLAETMVKLQAAETALQSIEAIRVVLKKENAVMQAREIILGKALIAQRYLEGAAESKNIVIRYAAIAAQKALNAVMSLSLGPTLAIIAAIAVLVPLLTSWTTANETAAKSLDRINAELDESVKRLDSYVDAVGRSGEENIAKLEANFAAERDIRKAQVGILYDQQRETRVALTLMRQDYENAVLALEGLAKKSLTESLSDREKADLEKYQKIVDTRIALRRREEDISSQIEVTIQNNRKADIEEARKAEQLRIEIVQKSLETRGKLLQEDAGNEEKSYQDRIQAVTDFYTNQRRIIELEAKKQRLTPGQTPEEIKKIEAEKTAALKEAERTRANQTNAFRREEAERIRRANEEIFRTELEDRAEHYAAVANNEENEVDERSDALAGELQDRITLIKAGLAAEIAARKSILPEERTALQEKANREILNLQAAFNMRLIGLNNERIQQEDRANQSITNRRRDQLLKSLAEEYRTRQITSEQYEKKKFDIEARYASESIQLSINTTKAQIAVAYLSFGAKKELLEKLAALERELAEKTNSDNEARAEKEYQGRVKRVNEFAALSNSVADIISEITSIGYEREAAAIESSINALEKKKQKDIEVANASIANEQERAAAITTIELRAGAEREALERRRRQLEAQRARTERYITIGRIIADTAAAVVAALGTKPYSPINIALAAATGALGAAQLAKVLATPLPQFRHGKDENNKYEGFAIVGDGGKKERIIREDGTHEITPAVPTLTYVRRNDIILPDADQAAKDIALAGTMRKISVTAGATVDNSGVIRAIEKGNKRVTDAIKGQPKVSVEATHLGLLMMTKYGNDGWKYIQDQTNWS